jgi:hypothetical protein
MLMIIVELPCGNFHNHTKYLSLELSMILILPYIYLVLEFSTLTMKHDNYNSCILSTLLEVSFIAMIYDCHTRFPEGNQIHLICVPGSSSTHMIDEMSVIS